jgi:hypothetical protein
MQSWLQTFDCILKPKILYEIYKLDHKVFLHVLMLIAENLTLSEHDVIVRVQPELDTEIFLTVTRN